jgi:hypothetical protein
MRKLGLLLVSILLLLLTTFIYQTQESNLRVDDVQLKTRLDAFGVESQVLTGQIVNDSRDAYININVFADVLNDEGDIIGEAFGFVVDACGIALVGSTWTTPLSAKAGGVLI